MNTEALKALLEQSESDEKACEQLGAMSFELAAEVIKLREQQRWIPVGERLPCKYTDVLLWTTEGQDYGTLHVFDDGRHFINGCFDGTKVTHWMPLPEAPTGEQA